MKNVLFMIDGLGDPPDTWFDLKDQLLPLLDHIDTYDRRDSSLPEDVIEASDQGYRLFQLSHSFGVQAGVQLTHGTARFLGACLIEGVWETPQWQRQVFYPFCPRAISFIRRWKYAGKLWGPPSMGLLSQAGHVNSIKDLGGWGWKAHNSIIEHVTAEVVAFFQELVRKPVEPSED